MGPKKRKKAGGSDEKKPALQFEESPVDSCMPDPAGPRGAHTCEVERAPFSGEPKWVMLQFQSLDRFPPTRPMTCNRRKRKIMNKGTERLPESASSSRAKNALGRSFAPIPVEFEYKAHLKHCAREARSEELVTNRGSIGVAGGRDRVGSAVDAAEDVSSNQNMTCLTLPPDTSTPDLCEHNDGAYDCRSVGSPKNLGDGSLSCHSFDGGSTPTTNHPSESQDCTGHSDPTLGKFSIRPVTAFSVERLRRCLRTVQRNRSDQDDFAVVLAPDTPEVDYGLTLKARQLKSRQRLFSKAHPLVQE